MEPNIAIVNSANLLCFEIIYSIKRNLEMVIKNFQKVGKTRNHNFNKSTFEALNISIKLLIYL